MAEADQIHGVLLAAQKDIPLTDAFDTQPYRDWVRGEIRKRRVWIAVAGGALAGVVVMDVNEIFYLVTAEGFRRRGVGQALVRHVVADTLGRYRSGGVTAKVRKDNQPIIELLTREGFHPHPIPNARPGWQVYFVGNVP